MANGHVEIHNPFSNHNGSTDRNHKSTSDPESMEDTVEFRLLMAYAKRRLPQKESPPQDTPSLVSLSLQTPDGPEKEEKKKNKKRRMIRWRRNILSCIKPKTKDEELPCQMISPSVDVDDRCGDLIIAKATEEEREEDKLNEAAKTLTEIADDIPFIRPSIETDAPEDVDENVEKLIGLLLRGAGDRLNESELKDANISTELFLNYSFFKLLMTTLLKKMGLMCSDPESPGPKASPKAQIAVACEVTSRLYAVNTLPRNRLLDHGARYLQNYYSSWAQQQGGYEDAFYSEDEDDIQ
ncbi:apoptosis facilitator Bcl-2-like protein 14 [Anoplopoma fimbria]|uniref:apoptosis facilitator Bcl-2-like protein 14 n=1 Tax=Anoplopoma fimbria TaxID=229290 RepID=UPI0023EE0943|nr:apoptosis facilitator Bcl-2-like protein 14 [Anoplopoma fimbria]